MLGNRVAALAAVVGAVALGAAGCARTATSDAQGPATTGVRTIEAHAYQVDSSPDGAVRFFRNAHVFEGTVASVGTDVRVAQKLSDGRTVEAVYTPVTVKVERGYKGGAAAGSTVTVRSMGGQADGLRFVIDDAPAKATFAPGSRLLVFGGQPTTLDGEKAPAITPNFVYRRSGGAFVDATYAHGAAGGSAPARIGAEELRQRLARLR
jgi:hypothetical protein